ncbi:hypothetical protein DM860_006295 [Cuscuta australis]|uniref:Homeobox domain-containing protein n=1 Tax=Cuscuta australis TaxID=267555 RepID=A0A328DPI4_9ASTE|nr:hypothetical protein DM860_006295 [Cuscuta australis]
MMTEEENRNGGTAAAAEEEELPSNGSHQNGSRWNPTKEQINLLERFYNEGIRTPSAEQIQQITAVLRAFGHIEGKNVFYWFQNHKARQRQKLKQHHFAAAAASPFFNPSPSQYHHFPLYYNFPPQSRPNVIYRPYQPQSDVGLYTKSPGLFFPAVETPGYFRKSPKIDQNEKAVREDEEEESKCAKEKERMRETLELFPLCPTGILHEQCSNKNSITGDRLYENAPRDGGGGASPPYLPPGEETEHHPFIDFFSGI